MLYITLKHKSKLNYKLCIGLHERHLIVGMWKYSFSINNWFFCRTHKEPPSANIILPNGNTFSVGSDISIQCDVRGYPQPIALWYKDEDQIQQSQRIRISGINNLFVASETGELKIQLYFFRLSDVNTLTIYGATADDSGKYVCHARNEFGQSDHQEQINVEGNLFTHSPINFPDKLTIWFIFSFPKVSMCQRVAQIINSLPNVSLLSKDTSAHINTMPNFVVNHAHWPANCPATASIRIY